MHDIIFISNGTDAHERLYLNFKNKYLLAKKASTYEEAKKKAMTKLFWLVWPDHEIDNNFKFDYQVPEWDYEYLHVFKNSNWYDGICLCSKQTSVSEREFKHRFFINKKEIDIQASIPRPFDIVFISYQEPNAEENWKHLKEIYPRALRIHGINGIHQAHIEAAKLATSEMFWVVDGDAIIEPDFKFEFEHIPFYDSYGRSVLHKIVHVWKSKNPINGLIYGYGGVKLLPRDLTINMDVSNPDMTTSISTEFKSMPSVSNITAFNTDAFSTWRSAFRECCKLSSKTIQGQVDSETEQRLDAWCTLNESASFGFHAYLGALAGRAYGEKNASNKEALSKINDFNWLQDQWSLEKSQL